MAILYYYLAFLFHVMLAVVVLTTSVFVYMKITPRDELTMIMKGDLVSSITLSGAILGIAVPLVVVLATWSPDRGIVDLIFWGVVSLVFQILFIRASDYLIRFFLSLHKLEVNIDDNIAVAVLLSVVEVVFGLLTAGALLVGA